MSSIPVMPVPMPKQERILRPAYEAYFEYMDRLKGFDINITDEALKVIFHIPMPGYWSDYYKAKMVGMPHRQMPDIMHYLRGLFNIVLPDHSRIWQINATKLWSDTGRIIITRED